MCWRAIEVEMMRREVCRISARLQLGDDKARSVGALSPKKLF
jgi:hypothetical protein